MGEWRKKMKAETDKRREEGEAATETADAAKQAMFAFGALRIRGEAVSATVNLECCCCPLEP